MRNSLIIRKLHFEGLSLQGTEPRRNPENEQKPPAMNEIDRAFYAMDAALRDPAFVPLYYNPLGYDTGISVNIEDLERLFPPMAEAAHLFRLYDGPAPAHWADTWERMTNKCAAVCREASTQYHFICAVKGQPISGEIRQRLADWDYMAALFSNWPARCGAIGPDEPTSIAKAAGIGPVEVASGSVENAEGAKEADSLYHLKTAYNRQQLACIFARLVAAGYIDGSTPEALGDFLNAFDPAAKKQGRISWIWTDKRQGQPAPRHILDFVAQMDGGSLDGITPELYNKTAPVIFGRPFGRDIVSEFVTRWNAGKYCDTHADIYAIISGR